MTEPEDLEEDLFADLYDNDDNANQPSAVNSAVPLNPFTDSTKETEPSTYGQEPDTYMPEEAALPEESVNGAHGGNSNGFERGHDEDDVHMNTEPFGSNIKEDG